MPEVAGSNPATLTMEEIWVIYYNCDDYPGGFVLRRHVVVDGQVVPTEGPLQLWPTLALARSQLPDGLGQFMTEPPDPPSMVEWWATPPERIFLSFTVGEAVSDDPVEPGRA